MSNSVDSSVQPCPFADEKEEDNSDKTEFVKFTLVDADNGKPISDVVLDIELPDGSFRVVSSDASGVVNISNIDPGTCKLHSDWRELIDSGITIDQMVLIK